LNEVILRNFCAFVKQGNFVAQTSSLQTRKIFKKVYGIPLQAASNKWKLKAKKRNPINRKTVNPTLKGASHEGENEREGRRRRWWRWRSVVTAPVPDECFDESRPNRDSSCFEHNPIRTLPISLTFPLKKRLQNPLF